MLVESGLSNYQALAAATRTPGEFIAKYVPGAERIGVVSPGARADLLLVSENPLTSLETLRGVMSAGRWRTSGEIQAQLEENRRNLSPVLQGAFAGAEP
jgi:imidazolonepropionase-like amidohydrolase